MSNVRSWYIYIVSAISLQAVTWSIIFLLRFLTILDGESEAIAFQIAVIIIGLPVFLGHWLWAQRLATRSIDERENILRRIYLYGNLAAFLGPISANLFALIQNLFGGSNDFLGRDYNALSTPETFIYHLLALVFLGALWVYHRQIIKEDSQSVVEEGALATVRRFYIFGFSTAGLVMTVWGVIALIRFLMVNSGDIFFNNSELVLATEIARLMIGVSLWLLFWRWAQALFEDGDKEENLSALRKFYLYALLFISSISTITSLTGILAGIIRSGLGLEPEGDLSEPLPVIIGMGLVWGYHAWVLRHDARLAVEAPRQALIRRATLYLTAGIGLVALLIGLGGDTSVIIRSIESQLGDSLKEELAWFTAVIIAGLPVWIIPWRQLLAEAELPDPEGADARGSIVRKIYLYFFALIATVTLLFTAIFIVFSILTTALGNDPVTFSELAHAIAFSLIATAVWLYHGNLLRSDWQAAGDEQDIQIQSKRVVVIDGEGSEFGQTVVQALRQMIDGISLDVILVPSFAESEEETAVIPQTAHTQIAEADLIVGPWQIASAEQTQFTPLSADIQASKARKLLIPLPEPGWDWVGISRKDSRERVKQTAVAVKQLLTGKNIYEQRQMGIGSIIGTIIGVVVLLIILSNILVALFSF